MKGRKPKPTILKLLEGNPGRQRLPEGEPEPELGVPDPPDYLCPYALEEWQARAPGLARMRLLGKDELAVFASYCQAYADMRLAREQMKAMQEKDPRAALIMQEATKEGKKLRRSLLYVIAKESALDLVRYAAELGLTPSARARVATIPVGATRSGIRKLMYAEKTAT